LVYSINKEINPVEKEQFSLKKLLQERIEVFEAFERNSFYLTLDDIQLEADKIGFEKTVDNLLVNAMKYSDKVSSITITMEHNILSITDKGIGMDETELLKVYERYYQADSKLQGDGIGLALVKAYCDEEGISIDIKSKKGQGTSVFLNLNKVVQL
jgi:signal transduction histidine kinase